jgi:hypothetical protein
VNPRDLLRRHGALCMLLAALPAAGLAGWGVRRALDQQAVVAREQAALRAELAVLERSGTAESTPGAIDFAARLPSAASVDGVVRDVQRASGPLGVTFVSLAAVERPPTEHTLGRLELRLVLRGPYAGVKAVVAEALARLPGAAILQRLAIRRLANPAELDAQADLLLPSRPLAAAQRS